MKEQLIEHFGHEIEIAKYADQNIALECTTCYTVLVDYDLTT